MEKEHAKIIEFNPFSGADFFACDRSKIVEAIEEHFKHARSMLILFSILFRASIIFLTFSFHRNTQASFQRYPT